MVFVFFKNKMGRGTQHRIDRGKLFCHELCNCTHGFRLDHNGKIIAAGHQVYRSHLAVLIDSLGNLVKAHLALRRYLYFDQCNDLLLICIIPVNQGMVSADDMFFFHLRYLVGNRHFTFPQQDRQVFNINPAVL